MSLNWDVTTVKNYENMKTDEDLAVRDALVWLTLFVDYGHTGADYDEFVWRVKFYEATHGAYLTKHNPDTDKWEPRPLSVEEIRKWEGLSTNVTNSTRPKFINKIAKQHREDTLR